MNGEQKIIVAGIVVLAFGIGKAAIDGKPLDKPLVGGISFILLLSLVSAFGPALSDVAGNLALLGMTTVLLVDGPAVLQQLQKTQGATAPTIAPPRKGGNPQ